MKSEEAIEVLKRELNSADIKIFPEVKCALDMAIEALEKQISQIPTIENGFVKCPNCGAKMEV